MFPEAYQRAAALIETGTLVLVRGKLERDDETVRILATEIAPLDSVRERLAREVAIHLTEAGRSRHARNARRDLSRATAATGRCRSRSKPASRRTGCASGSTVSSQIRVRPSPALIAEVEQIVGARIGGAAMNVYAC